MPNNTAYQLTHKITILHDVSSDSSDAPDPQPLFSDIWAAKQGLSERLFYGAGTTQSDDSATFIIRYTKSRYEQIRPMMQLVDSGEENNPYQIVGTPVDIYDDRRWLKIHAKRNIGG